MQPVINGDPSASKDKAAAMAIVRRGIGSVDWFHQCKNDVWLGTKTTLHHSLIRQLAATFADTSRTTTGEGETFGFQ